MSRLVLAFLLFTSISVNACNEPIRFLYGPYVTLLMVKKLLEPMHTEVEAETGCEVEYTLAKSFEDLADDLVKLEHDYAFLPSAYAAISEEMGYERLASVKNQNIYVYIVVRANSGIDSIFDLEGKTLMSISSLSASGAEFEQLLKDKNILNKINIVNEGTYEQNVFRVLSKQADAAILIHIYWMELDKIVKNKMLKVLTKIEAEPAELVKRVGRDELSRKVFQALKQTKSLDWEPSHHQLRYNGQLKANVWKYIQSTLSK